MGEERAHRGRVVRSKFTVGGAHFGGKVDYGNLLSRPMTFRALGNHQIEALAHGGTVNGKVFTHDTASNEFDDKVALLLINELLKGHL